MKRKILIPLAILVVIIAAIAIYFTQKPKEPETIKIGAILPLTGNLAFMGEFERNGMLLAADEINNSGGINGKRIEIVFGDSKGQPKEAVSIANKFINIDKIKIIITSMTSVSLAIAPLAHEKRVILAAFCMDPTIHQRSKYVIRLYESMGQEAEAILSYFANLQKEKIRGVAILYVRHPGAEQQFRDYFIPGFRKLNIKILFAEPYELSQTDFRTQILKIEKSGADHLIVIGYGFAEVTLLKQLKEYGIISKLRILGGWNFAISSARLLDLSEGIILGVPEYAYYKNEKAREFVKSYMIKYGVEPNFDEAFAYLNIMLLADAIKRAERYDPDSILSKLLNLKIDSIMGNIQITGDGELVVPMGLGVIKGGKIEKFIKN
jgi:branched-chain amino acid transport system substrate-binding protein